MAMPIWALAAAVRRSAAAMSGRRWRSCEGTPRGTLGSGEIHRVAKGNAEVGKFAVGDGADGVLVLGARYADVDELGAHGFKLRVGLCYVHIGGYSAGKTALGEVELALEVGYGGLSSLVSESRPRSWK